MDSLTGHGITTQYTRKGYVRIIAFIVLSFAVHGLVLKAFYLPVKPPEAFDRIQKHIAVKVLPAHQPVPPDSKPPHAVMPAMNAKQPADSSVIRPLSPKPIAKIEQNIETPQAPKIMPAEEVDVPLLEQPMQRGSDSEDDAIGIRAKALGAIEDIMWQLEPTGADSQTFPVFHPGLARGLQRSMQEGITREHNRGLTAEIPVQDRVELIGGYQQEIISGKCWLIPDDNSFDELDARIPMRDPGCDIKRDNIIKIQVK